MFRYTLATLSIILTLGIASPAHAWYGRSGHGWGGGPGFALGFGVGACCGYNPYYSPYYAYPTYYAPPTVVYETAPTPPVTYVVPQAGYSPTVAVAPVQPVAASSASEIFTDSSGRTCRHFQSTIEGAPVSGTACLQQDGSWHTVSE